MTIEIFFLAKELFEIEITVLVLVIRLKFDIFIFSYHLTMLAKTTAIAFHVPFALLVVLLFSREVCRFIAFTLADRALHHPVAIKHLSDRVSRTVVVVVIVVVVVSWTTILILTASAKTAPAIMALEPAVLAEIIAETILMTIFVIFEVSCVLWDIFPLLIMLIFEDCLLKFKYEDVGRLCQIPLCDIGDWRSRACSSGSDDNLFFALVFNVKYSLALMDAVQNYFYHLSYQLYSVLRFALYRVEVNFDSVVKVFVTNSSVV